MRTGHSSRSIISLLRGALNPNLKPRPVCRAANVARLQSEAAAGMRDTDNLFDSVSMPRRRRASATMSRFQSRQASRPMCWSARPPQAGKCLHAGSTLSADGSSTSSSLPRPPSTSTLTRSPGQRAANVDRLAVRARSPLPRTGERADIEIHSHGRTATIRNSRFPPDPSIGDGSSRPATPAPRSRLRYHGRRHHAGPDHARHRPCPDVRGRLRTGA